MPNTTPNTTPNTSEEAPKEEQRKEAPKVDTGPSKEQVQKFLKAHRIHPDPQRSLPMQIVEWYGSQSNGKKKRLTAEEQEIVQRASLAMVREMWQMREEIKKLFPDDGHPSAGDEEMRDYSPYPAPLPSKAKAPSEASE
jgi:hypothetical protein